MSDAVPASAANQVSHTRSITQRLDRLEVQIAYQDQVIDDLNKVIVDQWAQMNRLQSQIARLEDRIHDSQNNSGADGHDEPPPPHY